jgi:hypothetical protein
MAPLRLASRAKSDRWKWASAPTSFCSMLLDDRHLVYHWGVNLVAAVVKDGRLIEGLQP